MKEKKTLAWFYNWRLFLAIFFFSVCAQSEDSKSVPDIVVQETVKTLTDDFFNLAKAALIASNNGGLKPQVEVAFNQAMIDCKKSQENLPTKVYRPAFDSYLQGKSATTTVNSVAPYMQTCLDDASEKLKAVDFTIELPGKKVSDFVQIMRDPSVLGELKKIDPSNIFLKLARREGLGTSGPSKKGTRDIFERPKELVDLERNKREMHNAVQESQDLNATPPGDEASRAGADESKSITSSPPKKKDAFLVLILAIVGILLYFSIRK